MKQIIANEIKKLINRYPEDNEINSCVEYIEYWSDGETSADDLRCMVSDWFDENMKQCENCGQFHLISEMTQNPNGWFCDQTCEFEYDDNAYSLYELERSEYSYNVLG